MSEGDIREEFLYKLPSSVLWQFHRVMDGLSDLDWTRFASEVLSDQTAVRLAVRKERRTDLVMNQWENRNGRVGELLDLLERLQLLRARDIILSWTPNAQPPSPPLPPLPPPPPPPPPPPVSHLFDPPPKRSDLQTRKLSTTGGHEGGVAPLPKPAPPPPSLQSHVQQPHKAVDGGSSPVAGVLCWSYEEVHAGTEGFSPTLHVGEGGFGNVYRASIRNTDCAVKKLKEDSPLLKESFKTEVEKLSQFRHPNIVDLLGFCEGGGSFCLIFSYMENRSLEDRLHSEGGALSWSQRVGVVEGASTALQFLHSPPQPHKPLIHGDVKSSNILLDRHLVAKLADFGLAQFARSSDGRSASQTTSVGQTADVRGTLAYLPLDYLRSQKLEEAVDVYSFGVVLLEVLTGRRALERDRKSETYLKDLVQEVKDPAGSSAAAWRDLLDPRLLPGGGAEPTGCMDVAALAYRCLNEKRGKRPRMAQVFKELQDIHNIVRTTDCSSSSLTHPHHLHHPAPPFPRPPQCLESSIGAVCQRMSRLGPLEDTYQPLSSSSSSSSSCCVLTPPHPLHSSSLPPLSSHPSLHSSSLPVPSSSSSFAGPCETDESQGFSQFYGSSHLSAAPVTQLRPPRQPNGTHSGPSSLSPRDQWEEPSGPTGSHFCQPSVPTEDQYNFPLQPSSSDRSGSAPPAGHMCTGALRGSPTGPPGPPGAHSHCALRLDTRVQTTAAAPALNGARTADRTHQGPSPNASLRSSSPGPSVLINPSKQRFLAKKTLYEEGRIQTPELLSSDDLYVGRTSSELRGPEESDELDYLPSNPKK
ncbi:interleukin-1 receptor-associated kinase 1 isoform X2 [Genypterus blacodes]|uniref:interleukin-1 receptor-associated kinase 1 isoform X2 n=1 Tax=Genypterus blacodes TaxID=154954 RepID=UPI003F77162A